MNYARIAALMELVEYCAAQDGQQAPVPSAGHPAPRMLGEALHTGQPAGVSPTPAGTRAGGDLFMTSTLQPKPQNGAVSHVETQVSAGQA